VENKRELDARAEVGIPQPIQTNNLLKESGKEIIEKIDMVEKNVLEKFDKSKKTFDNYGLAKEVTDQFKEIDTCLIKRTLYGEKKYKSKTSINASMIDIR